MKEKRMNNLETKIEAILFFKGEPLSLEKLQNILKVSGEEARGALESLSNTLASRGLRVLERDDKYTLGTAPEYADLIEDLQKEELNKDLSKASLETLSIILYKNGANRGEIDYIRGVNSSFTLRALSVRGLVERVVDPKDSRRYIYKPTMELLSYLGVTKIEDLPEYGSIANNLKEVDENLEKIKENEESQ